MRRSVRLVMSNKFLPLLGLVVAAVSAMGCSSIRVVQMSREGGEIALFGDMEGAMESAREEMAYTCGGPQNYEIVRQGEVVVGEVTTVQERSQPVRGPFGRRGRVRQQQVVTQPAREWHVFYRCVGPAAPPAQAASMHELRFTL